MRIVLDTNVLVSAVFFGGVPGRILEAWHDGRVQLVLSAEILDEYQRVGLILSADHAGVRLEPFLGLLAVAAEFVVAPALPEPASVDPDDDKFLACAWALQELSPRAKRPTGGAPRAWALCFRRLTRCSRSTSRKRTEPRLARTWGRFATQCACAGFASGGFA